MTRKFADNIENIEGSQKMSNRGRGAQGRKKTHNDCHGLAEAVLLAFFLSFLVSGFVEESLLPSRNLFFPPDGGGAESGDRLLVLFRTSRGGR